MKNIKILIVCAIVCLCVFSQSQVRAYSEENGNDTAQVEFTFDETAYIEKYSKVNERQILEIFEELGKCENELTKKLGQNPTENEIKNELAIKGIFTDSLDQKTITQMLEYVDIKFTSQSDIEMLQEGFDRDQPLALSSRDKGAVPLAQDTKVLSPYVQYWSVKPKLVSKPTHTCKVTISRAKNIATSQHSIQGISTTLTSGYGSSFGSVTSNTKARATVIGKGGLPVGERYYTMSASSGSISYR